MKRTACLAAGVLAAAVLAAVVLAGTARAQEREDRTLLGWDQMKAIINEVSGERPLQTVLEMVPYPRVRPRAEYEGRFRESEVMARLASEYGFSNVEIEVFPQGQRLWQATRAELWLLTPEPRKLYDFRDIPVVIAAGSQSGEVAADLVDVGQGGRPEDYAGKDVVGKVVLGSAGAGQLQRLAVFERGAVGVLSYNPIHADTDAEQIGSQSISPTAPAGKVAGFGWSISPRLGRELSQRLGRGEALRIRSIVQAETFPGRLEMVHAVIPGDGSSEQELAVSGHLYEGYIKQGANDDASGCALTLEMGRALIRLVGEGKLPKPKRTIHFLWVPEISGTSAWLQKHADVTKKLVADLNFDMEGLGLARHGSFWTLHRTPDSFPSFLNDVAANVMEVVANLNRERVRYRSGGYGFGLPVVAPSGSQDPFYVLVEKHYGASDHVVYMANGIPSVMFITWPDVYYHSSKDTPDKLDATQFKRAGVVGLATLTALASADKPMAVKVMAETLARGTERVGQAQRKGLGYIADAGDATALANALKEARNAVRHQVEIEKGVLRSAAVLFPVPAEAAKQIAAFEPLLDQRAAALQAEMTAVHAVAAAGSPAAATAQDDAERRAAGLIVTLPDGAEPASGGFGNRRGQGPVTPEREAVQAALRRIPGHMTAELRAITPRRLTVLQIRDFLAGEFEPLPAADVLAYFEAQERAGFVRLVPVPEDRKRKK